MEDVSAVFHTAAVLAILPLLRGRRSPQPRWGLLASVSSILFRKTVPAGSFALFSWHL